jgi:hypothetical protein
MIYTFEKAIDKRFQMKIINQKQHFTLVFLELKKNNNEVRSC